MRFLRGMMRWISLEVERRVVGSTRRGRGRGG